MKRLAASVAAVTLPLALITACAPDDAAVKASLEAYPLPAELPPREQASAIGTEAWRVPTGIPLPTSHYVLHTGDTFLVAVQDGQAQLQSFVGNARTGAIRGSFALPAGAGWPALVGSPEDPTLASAILPADGSTQATMVVAWDASGAVRWTRGSADLGATAGTDIRVDPAEGDRVLVRSVRSQPNRYQDSLLWLLDAATGSTVWRSEAPVRWAQAASGLLMYTWRSDGAPDQPSDRVTLRSLADGVEKATVEVISDYGSSSSASTQCGGIASAERVVVCRWQGDQGAAILVDAAGNAMKEWPTSAPPVIDRQEGILTVLDPAAGTAAAGVAIGDGSEAWSMPNSTLPGQQLGVQQARDGVLVGSLADWNIALASRTGAWLVADTFEQIRPGAVTGAFVVTLRDDAIVGYTADGVGIGVLPQENDAVLFVRP